MFEALHVKFQSKFNRLHRLGINAPGHKDDWVAREDSPDITGQPQIVIIVVDHNQKKLR